MRKVLVLPLIALALALTAGLALAAGDAKGPPCANIIEADFFYNGTPSDPASGTTATVIMQFDVATCTRLRYKLVVLDSLAVQTSVASGFVLGDGEVDPDTGLEVVQVNVDVPPGERDGEVCLYAASSDGRRDMDPVPNTGGCLEVIPGGSAGGSGFG